MTAGDAWLFRNDAPLIDSILSAKEVSSIQSRKAGFLRPPTKEEWVNRTLLHMGYPNLNAIKTAIRGMVVDISVSVTKEAAPTFLFKSEWIESCSTNGFHATGLRIKSRNWGRIACLLEGPRQVCCFALTLGAPSEAIIMELSEQSIMQAFIWDALCSTLAEYYADQAEIFLAHQYAEKGLSITRRFSPGYCDLHLFQGQKEIFQFCHPEAIGIRLSGAGLMTPRKSITGMFLGAEKVPQRLPCRFCSRICIHRRIPEQTTRF